MSNQIEIRHLRYFLAVATDLHFRRAAESLFISQPGLSRQIAQLEEDIGYKLFERTNKSVKLTEGGLYLKNEIQLILSNLNKVFSHGKLISEGQIGHLKIGYIGSAVQKIIPDLLINLRQKNANIQFDLEEMNSPLQIEHLVNQTIDIGFARLNRTPKTIEMIPILEENFVLVLPKNHRINAENFTDIGQLKEESFILFKPSFSPGYHEKVMEIFNDSNFYPKMVHTSVNANTIFNLVTNNFGISIVPKSLVENETNKIQFIELKNLKQTTTLYLIYNKENRNPLIKMILEQYL